jgi:hypothetical protein
MMKKPSPVRAKKSPGQILADVLRSRRGDDDPPMPDVRGVAADDLAAMAAADLIVRLPDGRWQLTGSGRAHLVRAQLARSGASIDPYRAQHLGLVQDSIDGADGERRVTIDQSESPLAWLARRRGKHGKAHIEPAQLQAGERLRADFTRAQMMPRMSANWEAPVAQATRGDAAGTFGDAAVAARQRVHNALDAVGAEFSGLLVDICCFLKRLEDVERERGWPPRSAKVVLQLGLDRLARHYGYGVEARGPSHAPVRTWLAEGAEFSTDGV